ncbi:hypothetical protein K3495_g2927 [Podosphaera aphanis]|nr:hypothetical protein K3495_g2927 [Podosphaera aphanis]
MCSHAGNSGSIKTSRSKSIFLSDPVKATTDLVPEVSRRLPSECLAKSGTSDSQTKHYPRGEYRRARKERSITLMRKHISSKTVPALDFAFVGQIEMIDTAMRELRKTRSPQSEFPQYMFQSNHHPKRSWIHWIHELNSMCRPTPTPNGRLRMLPSVVSYERCEELSLRIDPQTKHDNKQYINKCRPEEINREYHRTRFVAGRKKKSPPRFQGALEPMVTFNDSGTNELKKSVWPPGERQVASLKFPRMSSSIILPASCLQLNEDKHYIKRLPIKHHKAAAPLNAQYVRGRINPGRQIYSRKPEDVTDHNQIINKGKNCHESKVHVKLPTARRDSTVGAQVLSKTDKCEQMHESKNDSNCDCLNQEPKGKRDQMKEKVGANNVPQMTKDCHLSAEYRLVIPPRQQLRSSKPGRKPLITTLISPCRRSRGRRCRRENSVSSGSDNLHVCSSHSNEMP